MRARATHRVVPTNILAPSKQRAWSAGAGGGGASEHERVSVGLGVTPEGAMADSYDDSGRPLLGEYDVEVSATSTGDDDDDEISPLIGVCPFILGNEFCERLAYYGLSTNLVVYFQQVLSLNTAEANLQVSIWSASCYVTPLIGAWLADSYWGRYKTIIIFSKKKTY